jgi:hypothetical protein
VEDDKLELVEQGPWDLIFSSKTNQEILKLCENGDIYVKGRLTENDKEVVEALREFLP